MDGDSDKSKVSRQTRLPDYQHDHRGHIKTSRGSYFIYPNETTSNDNHTPMMHVMYRVPALNMEPTNHCGVDSHDTNDASTNLPYPKAGPVEDTEPLQYVDTATDALRSHKRTRRSLKFGNDRRKRSLTQEYFVELMIVADRKMADYHGAELQTYVLKMKKEIQ
ncbi:hypothetical protein M8J75_013938 [Diaphorina citri]|nr:hypothetical protein M8J75_013938 [Diaphorina citri]